MPPRKIAKRSTFDQDYDSDVEENDSPQLRKSRRNPDQKTQSQPRSSSGVDTGFLAKSIPSASFSPIGSGSTGRGRGPSTSTANASSDGEIQQQDGFVSRPAMSEKLLRTRNKSSVSPVIIVPKRRGGGLLAGHMRGQKKKKQNFTDGPGGARSNTKVPTDAEMADALADFDTNSVDESTRNRVALAQARLSSKTAKTVGPAYNTRAARRKNIGVNDRRNYFVLNDWFLEKTVVHEDDGDEVDGKKIVVRSEAPNSIPPDTVLDPASVDILASMNIDTTTSTEWTKILNQYKNNQRLLPTGDSTKVTDQNKDILSRTTMTLSYLDLDRFWPQEWDFEAWVDGNSENDPSAVPSTREFCRIENMNQENVKKTVRNNASTLDPKFSKAPRKPVKKRVPRLRSVQPRGEFHPKRYSPSAAPIETRNLSCPPRRKKKFKKYTQCFKDTKYHFASDFFSRGGTDNTFNPNAHLFRGLRPHKKLCEFCWKSAKYVDTRSRQNYCSVSCQAELQRIRDPLNLEEGYGKETKRWGE